MINKDLLAQRIDLLHRYIEDLESLKGLSKEEFLKDPTKWASCQRFFQVAIESCLDIGNHIIAAQQLGRPKEYQDIFRLLCENHILPEAFAESLLPMVRFRNRLVHIYWEVSNEEIYSYLHTHLQDLREFTRHIAKYIKDQP